MTFNLYAALKSVGCSGPFFLLIIAFWLIALALLRDKKWVFPLWFPLAAVSFIYSLIVAGEVLGMFGYSGHGPDAGFAAMGAMFTLMLYGPFINALIFCWIVRPSKSAITPAIVVLTILFYSAFSITGYGAMRKHLSRDVILELRDENGQTVTGATIEYELNSRKDQPLEENAKASANADSNGQVHLRLLSLGFLHVFANVPGKNGTVDIGMNSHSSQEFQAAFSWKTAVLGSSEITSPYEQGGCIRNKVIRRQPVAYPLRITIYLMPDRTLAMNPYLAEVERDFQHDIVKALDASTDTGTTNAVALRHLSIIKDAVTTERPGMSQLVGELEHLVHGIDRSRNELDFAYRDKRWNERNKAGLRVLFTFCDLSFDEQASVREQLDNLKNAVTRFRAELKGMDGLLREQRSAQVKQNQPMK